MVRFLVSFAIVIIISILTLNAEEQFLKVEAKPGDGIYSLLRRYQLDGYACNFTKFYSLNNLNRKSALRVGKEYQVPLLVYSFNGKTIRSSIGNNDYDLAVMIQNYNEEMLSMKIREESFRKDRILWVPFHLLNCPDAALNVPAPVETDPEAELPKTGHIPTNQRKKSRVFPIFGPDFEYTPLKSNMLRGKVYYVVAGHGGPDPGAVGKFGNKRLCEDEYAYDVALRLCRNLIQYGATAYMINRDENDGIRTGKILKCDTDEVLWGGVKMVRHQKTRLFQRSDIVNELFEKHRLQGVSDQIAIMIHVDSRTKKEQTDLFFYYHPDSEESGVIARKLRNKMSANYKKVQKNRHYKGTVTARDLHMLRETKPLSVYIELANIKNSTGQQRIIVDRNRQLIANWLFEGLLLN